MENGTSSKSAMTESIQKQHLTFRKKTAKVTSTNFRLGRPSHHKIKKTHRIIVLKIESLESLNINLKCMSEPPSEVMASKGSVELGNRAGNRSVCQEIWIEIKEVHNMILGEGNINVR